MQQPQKKIDFINEFRAQANQLKTFAIIREWLRLRTAEFPNLTGAQAAAWANLGFTPGEATAFLRAGASAADVRRLEDAAAAKAGGKAAWAAQQIRELLARPGWVWAGPASDVVCIDDPVDDGVVLVVLREEGN